MILKQGASAWSLASNPQLQFEVSLKTWFTEYIAASGIAFFNSKIN